MEDKEFEAISAGLRASMRRYPTCRVASCDCNEFTGEWKVGCACPGHWQALDKKFGRSNWNFKDAAASQKAGRPVKAEAGVKEAMPRIVAEEMCCPQCGRPLTGLEYAYNDPEHYDGVSEWVCFPCGYHRGRWSGKILVKGEKEPKYGRTRAPTD